MNDVSRERPLSTADLAATRREEKREEKRRSVAAPASEAITEEVPIRGEEPARPSPEAEAARRSEEEAGERHEPLFAPEEAKSLRGEWDAIQIAFVDEPRTAVEKADQLVARAIQRLAEVFSDERNALEKQWARGDQVSTEDLRLALQRYRSFFGRLLSV
jgi:hypothetical protein